MLRWIRMLQTLALPFWCNSKVRHSILRRFQGRKLALHTFFINLVRWDNLQTKKGWENIFFFCHGYWGIAEIRLKWDAPVKRTFTTSSHSGHPIIRNTSIIWKDFRERWEEWLDSCKHRLENYQEKYFKNLHNNSLQVFVGPYPHSKSIVFPYRLIRRKNEMEIRIRISMCITRNSFSQWSIISR